MYSYTLGLGFGAFKYAEKQVLDIQRDAVMMLRMDRTPSRPCIGPGYECNISKLVEESLALVTLSQFY